MKLFRLAGRDRTNLYKYLRVFRKICISFYRKAYDYEILILHKVLSKKLKIPVYPTHNISHDWNYGSPGHLNSPYRKIAGSSNKASK